MSFQGKLLWVFGALVGVMVSLLIFLHYQAENLLLRKSVGNLRKMVEIVHFSTQKLSGPRHISRPELQKFLRDIKRKNEVFEVSVLDLDGKVVASTDSSKIGTDRHLTPDSIEVRMQTEVDDSLKDKARYEVLIPLVRDKQVEGTVEMSVFLNDLRSYLWKVDFKLIGIFLAALAVAFVAFFAILRRLHRPFGRLAEAAKQVAAGDFEVRLPSSRNTEEAGMAAAFNQMTGRLNEQRQLEERLRGLERRALLSELGASLAHEIRNPLNLMNLTLHHLSRNFGPEGEERRPAFDKLVTSMKNEVQHVNQIVTDFLHLGKPMRLQKRFFNLRELVSEVALRLAPQIAAKRLRLTFDCPDPLELSADPEQIRLVMLNLFLNCIQIVPQDSAIEFGAWKSNNGREVICAVSDHGPGIDPGELEKVFEPYFTKREGGVGLGLTLARRIVEEHGGQIRVANLDGGGARFQFWVPGNE